MNEYIVRIPRFFGLHQDFTVEAANKAEALEKAKNIARRYDSSNFIMSGASVLKKVNKHKQKCR